MFSNQPVIFHSVILEPINKEPLDDKANFSIEGQTQIVPLAKKVMLLSSVVQTLSKIDLNKNKVWVIGRTRDEITRYGITVKINPELPNQAIINVIKYRSLMTLQLQDAPKYREFLILVLPKEFSSEQFITNELDLRSLSSFGHPESSANFVESYIAFEKNVRGENIR